MKLNKHDLLLVIFFVFFIKLFAYIFIAYSHVQLFGGGNDSDYYHSYALGYQSTAHNAWPVFLRFLAEHGIYDRRLVSFNLFFLSAVIVPHVIGRLGQIKGTPNSRLAYLCLFLIVSSYIQLFYLSIDIYRDVVMVFLFLLGLSVFKGLSSPISACRKIALYTLGLCFVFVLYKFRPYLGFGYGVALLFSRIYSFKKFSLSLSIICLLVILQALYGLGYIDPLLEYRSSFNTVMEGGSNLGVTFSEDTVFLMAFLKSFFYQVLGLNFINLPAVFAFFLESLPFIFCLYYLIKNRRYADRFVDFMIVFSIAYSVVWLLGNDNLGTAARLRIFNYISVYICCAIVWQRKCLSMG